MAKKRGVVKPSEVRKKVEEASQRLGVPEAQVKEGLQAFSVSKLLRTHKAQVVGADIRIPLTSGVARDLVEIGKRLDKITGQKRKKKRSRQSAEIDIWAIADTPEGKTHLFLELKNLPDKENTTTIAKYYKYVGELSNLLKKHPYVLGTADTRSFPIAGLGKKVRVPVEKWQEADRMVYVLVTNRSPTDKEWRKIEKIKRELGHYVVVVRDYEIGSLVKHLKEGKTEGRFAGRNQKIVVHPLVLEGPLDKFLMKKKED